jgi:hypothetical protein
MYEPLQQSEGRGLKPVETDAINLARLRGYALYMERVSLAIYAADADPTRPYFQKLSDLLARHSRELRELAKSLMASESDGCPYPGDCRGEDGLCYPSGTCSSR